MDMNIVPETVSFQVKNRRKIIMAKKKNKSEMVEIKCRCKDCEYSDKMGDKLYCYFWDHEPGTEPNIVKPDGFCSNGRR